MRPGAVSRLSASTSVTDDHRALYYDGRAADNDHSVVVLIIVVRTALIVIGPATILFGLAWRHPTVAPSRLLSMIPARRALIRIAVAAGRAPPTPVRNCNLRLANFLFLGTYLCPPLKPV